MGSRAMAAKLEPSNVSGVSREGSKGFAVGSGTAGVLISIFGYHWLFIIDGSTCILAAFFFLFIMDEKPDQEATKAVMEKAPKSTSAYKDQIYLIFVWHRLKYRNIEFRNGL